jgi:hypothetical protein
MAEVPHRRIASAGTRWPDPASKTGIPRGVILGHDAADFLR